MSKRNIAQKGHIDGEIENPNVGWGGSNQICGILFARSKVSGHLRWYKTQKSARAPCNKCTVWSFIGLISSSLGGICDDLDWCSMSSTKQGQLVGNSELANTKSCLIRPSPSSFGLAQKQSSNSTGATTLLEQSYHTQITAQGGGMKSAPELPRTSTIKCHWCDRKSGEFSTCEIKWRNNSACTRRTMSLPFALCWCRSPPCHATFPDQLQSHAAKIKWALQFVLFLGTLKQFRLKVRHAGGVREHAMLLLRHVCLLVISHLPPY